MSHATSVALCFTAIAIGVLALAVLLANLRRLK